MLLSLKQTKCLERTIQDLKVPTISQIEALKAFIATRKNDLKKEDIDYLKLILISCYHSKRLFDILILEQRLHVEPLVLNYEKFDFIEVLRNCINELSILLHFYNVESKLNIDDEIPIMADRRHIIRVIEILFLYSLNLARKKTTLGMSVIRQNKGFTFEIRIKSKKEEKKLQEILKNQDNETELNSSIVSINNTTALHISNEIIKAHQGTMFCNNFSDNIVVIGFILPLD